MTWGSRGSLRRAAAAACAVAALLAGASAAAADWITWGNGSERLGVASQSRLHAANAAHLRLAWSRPLGGVGAAQPLAVSGQAVPGGTVYVAASESGRVTAFVAQTGAVLWTRELGFVNTACSELPHGQFGITSTPVYDPVRHLLLVAALDKLWGLDVTTGAPAPGWPVALAMDPYYEHVWGALAEHGDSVYVATASYCDRRAYAGRVIRVDLSGPAPVAAERWYSVEDVVPGGGGIWGWAGVAVTPDGHVWAATANANAPTLHDDSHWHAESVVELSDHLQLLHTSHATGMPIHGDYGFGSTPVVFTPRGCGTLVAAEGKDGVLYVWKRAALDAGPAQRVQLAFPATLYGLPSWDARTQRLYLTTSTGYRGVASGLQALSLTPQCRLQLAWTRGLDHQLDSVPTIANDVIVLGTGNGRLVVDAARGGRRLASRRVGAPVFAAPMVYGNDVVVVDWRGRISVFRLS